MNFTHVKTLNGPSRLVSMVARAGGVDVSYSDVFTGPNRTVVARVSSDGQQTKVLIDDHAETHGDLVINKGIVRGVTEHGYKAAILKPKKGKYRNAGALHGAWSIALTKLGTRFVTAVNNSFIINSLQYRLLQDDSIALPSLAELYERGAYWPVLEKWKHGGWELNMTTDDFFSSAVFSDKPKIVDVDTGKFLFEMNAVGFPHSLAANGGALFGAWSFCPRSNFGIWKYVDGKTKHWWDGDAGVLARVPNPNGKGGRVFSLSGGTSTMWGNRNDTILIEHRNNGDPKRWWTLEGARGTDLHWDKHRRSLWATTQNPMCLYEFRPLDGKLIQHAKHYDSFPAWDRSFGSAVATDKNRIWKGRTVANHAVIEVAHG